MDQSTAKNAKSSAREAIESLPDDSTWDDVLRQIYVHQKIEEGLADAEAGRFVEEQELRKHLRMDL
ncbi:MAG: hypothetical protein HUJ26_03830 [Planctomycetaceae bacterium]|nr:hypothetical protein [Planctomycetaceae bacterium]